MSHQTKVFGLRALATQIEAERIKLLGDRPKPGDAAHIALQRKIDGWKQTIQNVQRDLKSQSHFNHMVHAQNRFGPGAYAAKQRLGSKEANLREISDTLAQVAKVLVNLISALWEGPSGEERALSAMENALSNWLDSVKHSEDGVMGQVPFHVQNTVREVQVSASHPADAPGLPAPAVIDIFTLILAYFVLLKSLSKKT